MQQLAVSFQISVHKAGFYLYGEVTVDNSRVKRKQWWKSCISKYRINLIMGRMGLVLKESKYVLHEIIESSIEANVKLLCF